MTLKKKSATDYIRGRKSDESKKGKRKDLQCRTEQPHARVSRVSSLIGFPYIGLRSFPVRHRIATVVVNGWMDSCVPALT